MGSLNCSVMPWSAPPPAPKCPTCKKSVFAREAYMAADRTPFHLICLKCGNCQKKLTPATLNEHQHKLYCPLCYEELFCQKDNIPERTVMQVLPIRGLFIVEKTNLKEEAALAWKEATQQIDCLASSIKIRETVEIAPE